MPSAPRWLAVWPVLAGLVLTAPRPAAGGEDFHEVSDAADEPWRIASFLEDAGLVERTVFDIDFESDGTVWCAASDGLLRYDGYRWERIVPDDPGVSAFCRAVQVLGDGTVWVGTDRGAYRWIDGRLVPAPEESGLSRQSIRRISADPDGTLWFCCDPWPDRTVPGGLMRKRGDTWTHFGAEEGLPSLFVTDSFRDSRGRRFALTVGGLALLEGERFVDPLAEAGIPNYLPVTSLFEHSDGTLTALTYAIDEDGAGRDARLRWTDEGWSLVLESFEPNLAHPVFLQTGDGELLTCTDSAQSRFLALRAGELEPVSARFAGCSDVVRVLAEAPDGSIWAGGGNLLVRWERRAGEWRSYPDLELPRIRDDRGRVWFAGEGPDGQPVVRVLERGRWTTLEGSPRLLDTSPEFGVAHEWNGVLTVVRDGTTTRHAVEAMGLSSVEWVLEDAEGDLWAAGRATAGGFRIVSRDAGAWVERAPGAVPPGTRVESLRPHASEGVWIVARWPSQRSGLLHVTRAGARRVELPSAAATILTPDVLHDDEGRLWVYGFFGLYRSDGGGGDWRAIETLPGRAVFDGQRRDGEVWFAYNGSTGGFGGLARLRDGEWEHFPAVLGRLVGRDPNGTLLYSSDGGLCIVPPGDGPPTFLSVPTDLRVEGAAVSASGDVWAGIGRGVLRYRSDSVPPETLAELIGERVNAGEEVLLRVSGIERFRPRGSGARFRVSLRREGEPWTPFEVLGRDGITLAGLPVGTHRLAVRVQDEGLDVDPTPATVQFEVLPVPLQARWWFWPATLGIFAAIGTLAAMAIVAKRRLVTLAETLSRTVRLRTGELQASETKYRSLFEQSHDAVYVTDVDGVITNANRTTLELVGYDASAVLGARPTRLFVFEEDWAKLEADLLAGTPVRDRPCRIRTRDGKVLDTRVTANLRLTEDGRRIGTQVIFRDVTTEVRLQERLRQTQKMEAVGRLAGGVAHDFNNLLTAIRGYGELLALKTADDDRVSKDVQMVLEAAERAQDLTGQIQTFSRGQIVEPRVVDLNEVVAGMEKLLRRIIGEDVQLESLLDGEIDHVRMDPGQFEQVIVNLAVNARDAMPNGGRLVLETGEIDLDEEAAAGADLPSPGTYVLFQVRDTGQGIDASTQEKIFEPFFTTKGRGKGSGLGLATVYGIVRQAGGGITVHSSPGNGACFRIYLPPCDEEASHKSSVLVPAEVEGGSETILVVEDEAAIRGLIERLLAESGYRVLTAPDAERALEESRAFAGTIDLLLTDLVLPGRKGWELAEVLTGERRGLSVLFISGYAEVAEPQVGQGWQPAAPVLKKPFVPSALRAKVREILDRAATDRRRAVSRKHWGGTA